MNDEDDVDGVDVGAAPIVTFHPQSPPQLQSNPLNSSLTSTIQPPTTTAAAATNTAGTSSSRTSAPHRRRHEHKDDPPPISRAVAAALASGSSDEEEEENIHRTGSSNHGRHETEKVNASGGADTAIGVQSGGDGGDDGTPSPDGTVSPPAPTPADVYARPLMFYKRATGDRHRRDSSSSGASEPGPAELLLPDSSICLGFPPSRESHRRRQQRNGADDHGENVMVFTPPNEEQASKTKLWACILFFLIPADVILICTIFFLGGAVIDDENYNAGTTDLVTFLCALIALCLGLIGMKLKDTRILTLFIVIYYVDAILNLVRVSSILQLAQFFMQIGVCHCMTHYKSTLMPQWWIADA